MNRLHRALLERSFRRAGPWITGFDVDGVRVGGEADFARDSRLDAFHRAFPEARRVLELGALEGGHSFELARSADHVTAVEARAGNVRRARRAQRALGVLNVTFVCADVEVVGAGGFGRFDAVFCSGLLYHLSRPMILLDRLPVAAPGVYLWTHYASSAEAVHPLDGAEGAWRAQPHLDDASAGLWRRAFWPTLDAIVARLSGAGFNSVEVDEQSHPAAPAAAIVARV